MSGQYNLRNPAVKRLMKEAQELREPTEQYFAQPLEDNLFEWHFTIRGPADSEFDGGIYHGRITLPPEYPMKPPSIMLLTPNGRFDTFKKICLSISGHHPESWQPSWSIRTALLAIIGFMPTHGNGAIGSLDYTAEERKVLSKRSLEWKCAECGSMKTLLKPVTEASKKTTEEAKELASQINFQGEKEKNGSTKGAEGSDAGAAETTTSSGPSTATTETPGATGGARPTPRPPLTPGAPFNQAMFPPNFPTTMPNATMPSFMPRMMTPSEAGGAMPPFPRPFWPGMMPTMPGNGAMPARPPGGMMYPWPPMFNPMMMNAQMMAMMNQQMRMPTMTTQAGTVPSAPPSSSRPPATQPASSSSTATLSSQSATSRTSTVTTTTTATSSSSSPTGTSSSTPASQPAATSIPSSTVSSSQPATTVSGTSAASATATSSTTTTTPATSSTTSGMESTSSAYAAASAPAAPTTTADIGLRQRMAIRPPAPVAPPTYGAAELAAQSVRQGENPVVVMVMALLGLLIIALILRRLYYVVNAAAFDNDF